MNAYGDGVVSHLEIKNSFWVDKPWSGIVTMEDLKSKIKAAFKDSQQLSAVIHDKLMVAAFSTISLDEARAVKAGGDLAACASKIAIDSFAPPDFQTFARCIVVELK